MSYVSESTIESALSRLHGTAGHLLKIWLVLKHMGLEPNARPVTIDTKNSTESLRRLFGFGDPDGRFFVPFAHTKRYVVMKSDASRSIIQTTIVRWGTSGSVVTCDPTSFLNIRTVAEAKVEVSPGRSYPLGLGFGESGFALEEDSRVALPLTSLAVWYGRQRAIPAGADPAAFLLAELVADLHLSQAERDLIFVDDSLIVDVGPAPIADGRLAALCSPYIDGSPPVVAAVIAEQYDTYVRRVRSMSSQLDLPAWLRANAENEMKQLLQGGATAVLLYGPPRTGKTRLIDRLMPRDAPERSTIQIHDGWTYDNLIQGFMPDDGGDWAWSPGVLMTAINDGKTFIVLEEINRTEITQALGEVFSLIEGDYRGVANAITLRSGEPFFIPADVVIIMTMNTVDKSTEEVDDALLGRIAAVEFPPNSDSLLELLERNGVPENDRTKLAQVYAAILDVYPLGHGYFAGLRAAPSASDIRLYYKTRIRPVLTNFLGELRANELAPVENLLDQIYGAP